MTSHDNCNRLPVSMSEEFQQLIDEFLHIRRDLLERGEESRDALDQVHPLHRQSAENLHHYIALRSSDLRSLQRRLERVGALVRSAEPSLAKTTGNAAADEPVVWSASHSTVDPHVNLSADAECQHAATLDRPAGLASSRRPPISERFR